VTPDWLLVTARGGDIFQKLAHFIIRKVWRAEGPFYPDLTGKVITALQQVHRCLLSIKVDPLGLPG
jgi:hypothetical protein